MPIRLPRIPLPILGPAHIVLAVALLLLALFVYSTLQTLRSTYELTEQQQRLQGEVFALRQEHAQLQGLTRYLQSDEYIEAVARDRFGLVMPGEIAVSVRSAGSPGSPEAGTAADARPPPREAGERWWHAIFDP